MMQFGKITAQVLADEWRMKKALRGFDAPERKFEHGDSTKQMMTNVITLFPVQNGSVATLHNEAQSSTGSAEIGFDGPDWVPTIGDLSPDMPDESFPRFRRVSLNAAAELLRAIRPEYKGAADTGGDNAGSVRTSVWGNRLCSPQGESV